MVRLDEELWRSSLPASGEVGITGSKPVVEEERECYVEGFGTRQCIVQTYKLEKGEAMLYIDKTTNWMLKMEAKGGGLLDDHGAQGDEHTGAQIACRELQLS